MRLDSDTPKEKGEGTEAWKETLREIETEKQANEYGYTMLQHKDAIRFYARSIASQLERYLEEVYINGID